MHVIKIFFFASAFVLSYQAITTLIGAKILGMVHGDSNNRERSNLWISAPLIGISAHILLSSLIFLFNKGASGYALWVILLVLLIDGKRTIQHCKQSAVSIRALVACLIYAMICFSILSAYQLGPGQGSDWFWTIYRLTIITPGDSPQSMFQAQYLLYGHNLQGAAEFSLFDRPFFGGLITLFALKSFGVQPSAVYYQNTDLISSLYVGLWIWLNSLFFLGIIILARNAKLKNRIVFIYFIIAASPFIVFNVIGLWPKLFAVYILICALSLASEGKRGLSVIVSGLSFLSHGSFLWARMAFAGTLVLISLFEKGAITRAKITPIVGLCLTAMFIPAVWFYTGHKLGFPTPLQTYYLYDVSPSY